MYMLDIYGYVRTWKLPSNYLRTSHIRNQKPVRMGFSPCCRLIPERPAARLYDS